MSNAGRPSYVALFDILGFSDLVQRQQLPAVIDTLQAIQQDAEFYAEPVNLRVIQFSDTILLYSEGDEPGSFSEIVHLSAFLLGRLLERGVRMRGAITWGEFYAHNKIFAGKAMLRAYHLEKSQEWAGGIVDHALVAKITREAPPPLIDWAEDELLTLTHVAPIKGGPAGEFHCLAWPHFFSRRHSIDSVWPTDGTDSWDVLRKRYNTVEFLERFNDEDRPA